MREMYDITSQESWNFQLTLKLKPSELNNEKHIDIFLQSHSNSSHSLSNLIFSQNRTKQPTEFFKESQRLFSRQTPFESVWGEIKTLCVCVREFVSQGMYKYGGWLYQFSKEQKRKKVGQESLRVPAHSADEFHHGYAITLGPGGCLGSPYMPCDSRACDSI